MTTQTKTLICYISDYGVGAAQYLWPICIAVAIIIGIVIISKVGMYRLDDTFGGCLRAISDSLMDAYDKLREIFG